MRAKLPVLLGCVVMGIGGCPRPSPPPLAASPAFVNVAPSLGVRYTSNHAGRRPRNILEANGSGCAFLDYNQDGRLDLLLVGKPQCALFRNDGARFTEVTAQSGLHRPGYWIGAGAADWDNDGDPDLCLSGFKTGALYRNDDGRFVDITTRAGVRFPVWGQSPAFGDVDNDGLLDLYVSAYARFDHRDPRYCPRGGIPAICGPELYEPELGRLYRNLGSGRFREITNEAGLNTANGRSWGAAFQDYDDDGDTDLYVANDMLACDLFENLGGRFRNIGIGSGTAFDGGGSRIAGMAADWGDYDQDGRPDLLVSAFSAQHTVLFRQQRRGVFLDSSDAVGLSHPTTPLVGFGGRFLDFDLDGRPDLLLANGHVMDNAEQFYKGETYRQPLLLLRNDRGTFTDRSADLLAGVPWIVARGAAFGDFDNDGRTDVLVMDLEGQPLLLHNRHSGGRWLGLKLVGKKSNRDGLGARVLVTTDGQQRHECQTSGSLLSSNDPRIRVGLGERAAATEVTVLWPSGRVSRLTEAMGGSYLEVREP